MNILRNRRRLLLSLALMLFAWSAGPVPANCAHVGEREATAVADLWFAMELNTEQIELSPEEKQNRIATIDRRRVLYYMAKDDLRTEPPRDAAESVLAYVVIYEPRGYVVVSAEDRLDPVLTFNAIGVFNPENPERHFMHHYLATALVGRWDNLRSTLAGGGTPPIHTGWSDLRTLLQQGADLQEAHFSAPGQSNGKGGGGRSVYVLWDTPLWDQGWPYNETVQANNGNISGIPTGCTATAMAILMRYHEWPAAGSGLRFYYDSWGSVNYNHTVDYSSQTYDWSAMPFDNVTSSNAHVADLMYHCGVAVSMDYEVGSSGAWPSASAMNSLFRYKGTNEFFMAHDLVTQESILGGLPVVMSSTSHTVLACGYRDSPSPYYYINAGWNGGSNDWYNLDDIPGSDPTVDRSYPFCQPEDWYYVSQNGSPFGDGTLTDPMISLLQGNANVPEGGELWIEAGTYTGSLNVPITFDEKMDIVPYKGSVLIE